MRKLCIAIYVFIRTATPLAELIEFYIRHSAGWIRQALIAGGITLVVLWWIF